MPADRARLRRYFVVEDALPEELSAQMRDVLDNIRETKVAEGTLGEFEQGKQGAFSQANTLQTQEPILDLLTNERIFAKVVDLLGVNILCYHYHTNVTPSPEPDGTTPATETGYYRDEHKTFGYHKDTGMGQDIETPRQARFSLKAGYYFSDVDDASKAPTWVVPGKAAAGPFRHFLRIISQHSRGYAQALTGPSSSSGRRTASGSRRERSRSSARPTPRSSSTDGSGTVPP